MSQVKRYFLMLGLVLLTILCHFFAVIHSSSEQSQIERADHSTLIKALFSRTGFTAEDLSDLFAINYVEIANAAKNDQAGDANIQAKILLNDIDVFIRAISEVNDKAIIYVSYEQNGKLQREKIAIHDQLFGYTLIKVSGRVLTFKRDEQVINYTIFKAKKKTEGNR